MSKIKTIDRKVCGMLRDQIVQHLMKLTNEVDLNASVGRAKFSPTNVTFELTFSVVGSDGSVMSREREALDKLGELSGLKAKYGDVITHGGREFKIMGLLPKRSKFPVLTRCLTDDREILLTIEGVNAAVERHGVKKEVHA